MEKIAIFSIGREFTHVARQLADGRWTSKLGGIKDIAHTLESLTGGDYGDVVGYMQRPRPESEARPKRTRNRRRR